MRPDAFGHRGRPRRGLAQPPPAGPPHHDAPSVVARLRGLALCATAGGCRRPPSAGTGSPTGIFGGRCVAIGCGGRLRQRCVRRAPQPRAEGGFQRKIHQLAGATTRGTLGGATCPAGGDRASGRANATGDGGRRAAGLRRRCDAAVCNDGGRPSQWRAQAAVVGSRSRRAGAGSPFVESAARCRIRRRFGRRTGVAGVGGRAAGAGVLFAIADPAGGCAGAARIGCQRPGATRCRAEAGPYPTAAAGATNRRGHARSRAAGAAVAAGPDRGTRRATNRSSGNDDDYGTRRASGVGRGGACGHRLGSFDTAAAHARRVQADAGRAGRTAARARPRWRARGDAAGGRRLARRRLALQAPRRRRTRPAAVIGEGRTAQGDDRRPARDPPPLDSPMRSAGADARPPTTALRTSHGIRPVPPLESPRRGASSFADRMPGTSGRYRAVPRPSEDPDRVRRRCGRCPPRPASGRWCLRPPTRDTLLPTPWRRTLAQGDPGPAATPSTPSLLQPGRVKP